MATWVGVPLLGLGILAALLADPERNAAPADRSAYVFHFAITTIVSLLAFLAAFLVGLVAGRIRDTRALLLYLALASIAGFFTEHALGTPDVLIPLERQADVSGGLVNPYGGDPYGGDPYGEPSTDGPTFAVPVGGIGLYQVAGVMSLFAGALFFALSVRSWGSTAHRYLGERAKVWMGAVPLAFVVLIVGGIAFYPAFDGLPIAKQPSVWLLAIPTQLLFLMAAVHYARAYSLARLPMQWALVMGLILLAATSVAQAASPPWTWSWWGYHVLMLLGFLVILGGILYEFSRRRSLRAIMEGLVRLRSLVESELEYSDTISTLAAATEARDPYTRGHTARVAEVAVRIGQEMKLSAERLRVLARAGLLHDIGKLGTPDAILLKPGPLTDEEWHVMRRHPELGHDIVMRAGSLERESRLVRMHHERLDGKGYVAGLPGDEIPLDARILTVADVYDSLVTDRPYRKGYPPDRAMQVLREEAGTHLDPEVVEAWSRIQPRYHANETDMVQVTKT